MTRGAKSVVAAVSGLVVAVGLVAVVLAAAGGRQIELRLGSDTFTAGRTGTLADSVARDGPVTFPGLEGGDRPIIVHHLGGDPTRGWVAFEARAPGSEPDCVLGWNPAEKVFVDPCTETRYPPSGAGLRRLAVRVDGDAVLIDLRRSPDQTTTSTPTTVPVRRG